MGRNDQRTSVISAKSKELKNQNMDGQWLSGLKQNRFSGARKKVLIQTNLLLNQSARNPAGKPWTGEVLQCGKPGHCPAGPK